MPGTKVIGMADNIAFDHNGYKYNAYKHDSQKVTLVRRKDGLTFEGRLNNDGEVTILSDNDPLKKGNDVHDKKAEGAISNTAQTQKTKKVSFDKKIKVIYIEPGSESTKKAGVSRLPSSSQIKPEDLNRVIILPLPEEGVSIQSQSKAIEFDQRKHTGSDQHKKY
jgi:hypothetical protein